MKVKSYDELKFTDDFMFCKVLTEHPDICSKLVSLFTGRNVRNISKLTPQLTLKAIRSSHGVRFDVFFEDDDYAYDFEMQTTIKSDLPRRTRYYQSQMDTHFLKPGQKYTDLPDSYIVFICLEDPFDSDLCKYTFLAACTEKPDLFLGDGNVKLFINAKGIPDKNTRELKPFLDYLNGKASEDSLTEEIDDAVRDAIEDEEGRVMYMTLLERDEEKREEGLAEGLAKGRAYMVYSLVQDGDISPEKGAEKLDLSIEQFKENMLDSGYTWPGRK